jgi:hypothetical protein
LKDEAVFSQSVRRRTRNVPDDEHAIRWRSDESSGGKVSATKQTFTTPNCNRVGWVADVVNDCL